MRLDVQKLETCFAGLIFVRSPVWEKQVKEKNVFDEVMQGLAY